MRTIQRIWKQAKNTTNGEAVDVSHCKTKKCGRKRVQIDIDRFRNIPLSKRTSLESIAVALNVNKTTVYRNMKDGVIKRHSSAMKPLLNEENKIARLRFCLSMLESSSMFSAPKFRNLFNITYIDEKWFYMSKNSEKYYLLVDEDEPYRTCKSKTHITKVMFLAAIARPRFNEEGNELFSDKIGIFPFVVKEPAKRSSVNRAVGTLETKAITSVGRDIIRSYLIEKVLPTIREKWPREDLNLPIFIQQDNARTHVDPNDPEFLHASKQDGFHINLMCQPPNSPDLNILDLGFFNAIQSLQYKESTKTIDELVHAVENAYNTYPAAMSNRIFLTLQQSMIEIMKAEGSNKYKTPHMKKAVLEGRNQLPVQLRCDPEIVEKAISLLS